VRDAAGVAVERTFVELQHSFTVPADVEKAWATLLDLEGVAACFPGATLTGSDGSDFTGQVKVKLGPVSLQYAGKGRFLERDDAQHRVVIEAHGSDKRGNGTAGATVTADLQAEGEQATRVVVCTQLKVTGRPAQFGRGVMQDVGSKIVDQFAVALARQLSGDMPPLEVPEAAAADQPGATDANPPSVTSSPPPQLQSVPTIAPEPEPQRPPALADATAPLAARRLAAPRLAAPRPASLPRTSQPDAESELDLNAVVLPVLARQYGPTVVAVLVTALVTWWLARRRR
jgi:carbon monoxide dehydrogenase subunit G